MALFANFRQDPVTKQLLPVDIGPEQYDSALMEESNRHGFLLNEIPYFSEPSSVSLEEDGGDPFVEVPLSQAPQPGEFSVDYQNRTGDSGTGAVIVHPDDTGKTFNITYKGLGSTVKNRTQLNLLTTIPTSLGIEGDVEMTDNLEVEDDITSNSGDLNLLLGNSELSAGRHKEFGKRISYQDDVTSMIVDPWFDKGYWSLPESGVAYTDDSATDGGSLTSLLFTANSSLLLAHYTGVNAASTTPADQKKFQIPFIGGSGSTTNRPIYFNLNYKAASLNGTGFGIRIYQYDADGNALAGADAYKDFNLTSAAGVHVTASGSILPTATARYISVALYVKADNTTGTLTVSGLEMSVSDITLLGYRRGIYWTAQDAAFGHSATVLNTPQNSARTSPSAIFVGASGAGSSLNNTYTSYAIDGSGLYPGQATACIIRCTPSTGAIYARDANGNEYVFGALASSAAGMCIVVPIYEHYYSGGKSAVSLKDDATGTQRATIMGFIL